MANADYPLKVGLDGLSVSFGALPVSKLSPGTDKQSLFMNGSTPSWMSNAVSWSFIRWSLTSLNLNTGGTVTLTTGFPDLGASGLGSIGTGITTQPMFRTSATDFTCTHAGIYQVDVKGTLQNTDVNSGQMVQLTVYVNNIATAFLPKSQPLLASRSIGYQGFEVFTLAANDVVQIRATGEGTGNAILNVGSITYRLLSYTV